MHLSAAVGGGSTPAQALPVQASLAVRPATNATSNRSNRMKFSCYCGNNLWGKPSLRVVCMDCNAIFGAEVVSDSDEN